MNDEALLQRIYAHPEMRKIPVGYYSTVASVIVDILEDVQKENCHMVKTTMPMNGNENKECDVE